MSTFHGPIVYICVYVGCIHASMSTLSVYMCMYGCSSSMSHVHIRIFCPLHDRHTQQNFNLVVLDNLVYIWSIVHEIKYLYRVRCSWIMLTEMEVSLDLARVQMECQP